MFNFIIYNKPIIIDSIFLIEVSFNLFNKDLESKIHLFKVLLDKSEYLNWFLKNEKHIRSNHLPSCVKYYSNISVSMIKFYENVSEDDIKSLDTVFNYRKKHGLRFAFRGYDVPNIYVAKNLSNYYISFCDEVMNWEYKINIDNFFEEIKQLKSQLNKKYRHF